MNGRKMNFEEQYDLDRYETVTSSPWTEPYQMTAAAAEPMQDEQQPTHDALSDIYNRESLDEAE